VYWEVDSSPRHRGRQKALETKETKALQDMIAPSIAANHIKNPSQEAMNKHGNAMVAS
jgi:hypothetical protein